jgi:hypothetical protein
MNKGDTGQYLAAMLGTGLLFPGVVLIGDPTQMPATDMFFARFTLTAFWGLLGGASIFAGIALVIGALISLSRKNDTRR